MYAGYRHSADKSRDHGLSARARERPRGPVQQFARIVATLALMAASVLLVVAASALTAGRHGDIKTKPRGAS